MKSVRWRKSHDGSRGPCDSARSTTRQVFITKDIEEDELGNKRYEESSEYRGVGGGRAEIAAERRNGDDHKAKESRSNTADGRGRKGSDRER